MDRYHEYHQNHSHIPNLKRIIHQRCNIHIQYTNDLSNFPPPNPYPSPPWISSLSRKSSPPTPPSQTQFPNPFTSYHILQTKTPPTQRYQNRATAKCHMPKKETAPSIIVKSGEELARRSCCRTVAFINISPFQCSLPVAAFLFFFGGA